jgi:NADH-quinone oxidoreductase subunit M
MNLSPLPWLELAVAAPLIGALRVSLLRRPSDAARWCVGFTAAAFGCAALAWLGFHLGVPADPERLGVLTVLFGRPILALDDLSAPLLPTVALLHFLTALATTRTKMPRFSFTGMLLSDAIRLATFGCPAGEPWLLIALVSAGTVPPLVELLNRGKPIRVYALHMALFVGLLAGGWALVDPAAGPRWQVGWATVPLLLAVLVRSGAVPVHAWVTDLFEHATFGTALLFVTPVIGVFIACRLVLPFAPDWVLTGIGLVSLVTAVYAAGMAVVQREARRFFAYLFLSHASLVLVGLELHTTVSLTGALALWFSVMVSMCGLGLTLRAVEARFGRLSLADYHGLYDHSPALAVCFLLTGLGSVGFPGTIGFVSAELLADGAIGANLFVGLAVVLAAAVNGIAVLRAYFLLFTGGRHASPVSLGITPRERFAVLTLAAVVLGGGLWPQPGIATRHRTAEGLLHEREVQAAVASHARP